MNLKRDAPNTLCQLGANYDAELLPSENTTYLMVLCAAEYGTWNIISPTFSPLHSFFCTGGRIIRARGSMLPALHADTSGMFIEMLVVFIFIPKWNSCEA